jgi:hypothetical protein
MAEGFPRTPATPSLPTPEKLLEIKAQEEKEAMAIARELIENGEVFSWPGIKVEAFFSYQAEAIILNKMLYHYTYLEGKVLRMRA